MVRTREEEGETLRRPAGDVSWPGSESIWLGSHGEMGCPVRRWQDVDCEWITVMRVRRVRWFGHVKRREDGEA